MRLLLIWDGARGEADSLSGHFNFGGDGLSLESSNSVSASVYAFNYSRMGQQRIVF